MNTKDKIIETGNQFLIEKGYNAFSYADISKKINIKTSSIHYHFPTKADLCLAIIEVHQQRILSLEQSQKALTETEKLQGLFNYYLFLIDKRQICLTGTLASDYHSLEEKVTEKLKEFNETILSHTAAILESGIEKKEFREIRNCRLKALELLSMLVGLAQIGRLYTKDKIQVLMNEIIENLKL
ncbi:TetR/AcrR family transcriptional regulator [Chryseobacterium sp. L7]|uniref:TetR/AcrR family transcriptional regulator n=1 Tax=Chryseobacterium endalhagicum TaxID=2797638 RepID=A0ABS1QEP9_9FLAO|nr:TetR/AcrR family transcriptional regulator [Chryseobacterium endalhagicum]MBL1221076.1 TetR/AcrR family transcriptional regulator [Chryseobacterium endalhagicum]